MDEKLSQYYENCIWLFKKISINYDRMLSNVKIESGY